ncbi:MAG: MFS transporter, partial [Solirubrobacteraceae bacterium]|nr:MFS transporter [Patulibacter sp.]
MTAAPAASPTTAGEPYAKRWVLMVALCLCAFITGLDNTVLNIALPKLQADLGLSLTGLQWVGTSYILAFSSLLLVGGRLTDLFGRRSVLLSGMVIFTTASVLAGLAPTGGLLIAARVLQGVGGAFVLPATAGVLSYDVEPEYRNMAVGIWTASIASSIALGPIVGGAIVEVAHWSWIFFINLPVGVAAVFLIRKTVPPASIERVERAELIRRLDISALVFSALSLLGFTFALVHGQDHGFVNPLIIGAVVIGVVTGALFIRNERRTEFPLVDLDLFRSRIFSGGVAAQTIWGLGINGILFFTSLFLQDILDLEPFNAGLFYVPLAIAVGLGVPVGAKMADRWGVNVTVAIGMIIIAVGLAMGVFIEADDPPLRFLLGLIIVGIGSGLTTPMTAAVIEVVPHEQAGIGSAVVSTAREISGVLGIVAIGAVLVVRRQ